MAPPRAGDPFPDGVVFSYVPYTPEKDEITACGIPIDYNASKEWANKKVVLFSVPGPSTPFTLFAHIMKPTPSDSPRNRAPGDLCAFTPGCSARHLPGYIENLQAIKSKGVDIVAVIAFNDAWVMSAWSKANGIKNDDILFLSDVGAKFSQSIGWTKGERTARYAMVIDHGKVTYAEVEPAGDVGVSGAEAVLAHL